MQRAALRRKRVAGKEEPEEMVLFLNVVGGGLLGNSH